MGRNCQNKSEIGLEDGSQTIWDFDTLKDFDTVNGIKAHSGSMNGSGPVVADGMVFVNSGYSRLPAMAGNVLLAFAAE